MAGINSIAQISAIRIDGQVYVDGANPSYGANGFHLEFQDPNNPGLDTSGNGNNFTANANVTAADMKEDGPSENHATINSLYPSTDPPEGQNATDENLTTMES